MYRTLKRSLMLPLFLTQRDVLKAILFWMEFLFFKENCQKFSHTVPVPNLYFHYHIVGLFLKWYWTGKYLTNPKRCLIELPILYFVPVPTCTLMSLVPYRYRCLCMYRTTGYLLIVIESVYIFIFLYSQVWASGSGSMVQIQSERDPDPQHNCTVPTVLPIS